MQFNPDVNKQAVEVIFSCKGNKPAHPPIFFNDSIVKQLPKHKHLGLTFDSKLTFDKHIHESITKARKEIGVTDTFHVKIPSKKCFGPTV